MLARSAFAPRKRNSHRADAWKRAPQFLQWLRGRNCLLADKGGCDGKIEAAHVDYAGDKGMGTKVSDQNAIPLCSEHHRVQHSWGWKTFETNFGLGLGGALLAAEAFWKAWPGRVNWEASRRG
jgi:hypothetical protein